MQRYFIAAAQFAEDTVTIIGDDAHHLARVMRAQIGDTCICSNGHNREAVVEITELSKDTVTARILEELPMTAEADVDVWIAQSLPKGDKMEIVIQKGTEIGAAGFLPFVSERTIVQYDAKKEAKRADRWHKIAKEAAEQAHRNRIPELDSVLSWKELLKKVPSFDAVFICYEKEDGSQLRPAVLAALEGGATRHNEGSTSKLLVIIGPEGGLTENEVQQAEAAGCVPVSLGRRILRTETAALVAVTCILYEYGEMGG
jgi:16S rRNA (uracil1498-N3)-methyltransferase